MTIEDRQFTHSTLRERIVKHVFGGDILRTLWRLGVTDVEVLRPEFDAHGYDVVMSRGAIVRHVQLKTQAKGKVSVGRALAEKPSGCVVWIGIDKDTLQWGHSSGSTNRGHFSGQYQCGIDERGQPKHGQFTDIHPIAQLRRACK
jgi:hypothetical protein